MLTDIYLMIIIPGISYTKKHVFWALMPYVEEINNIHTIFLYVCVYVLFASVC